MTSQDATTTAVTRAGDAALQVGVVGVAVLCDMAVRWTTLDDYDTATVHAQELLRLEQAWGLDWEHAAQEAVESVPWVSALLAHVYVWGYFPVLLAALVWTWARRRDAYVRLRDALLVSGAIGLLVYATWPCAPPRLTGDGFTDSVHAGSLDGFARPAGLANEIAAVPSFHVGWLFVVAVVLIGVTRSRVLHVALLLHVVLMGVAVVASGNHWVLDLPAGLAVAAIGLLGAEVVDRWRRQRPPGSASVSAQRRTVHP
jgi:hypothetical protein